MFIDTLRQYCLQRPGVEETLPFGPDTLVFKVKGKVFALIPLDEAECQVNLKCDPERALLLRETYPQAVFPGYHMNKTHWNTVYGERGLPDALLRELVDHSYDLVVAGLPRTLRNALHEGH